MSRKQSLVAAERLVAIARDRNITMIRQMFTLDGPALDPDALKDSILKGKDNGDQGDQLEYHFGTTLGGRVERASKDRSGTLRVDFRFMGAYEMRVLHALIAASMGALPRGCDRYRFSANDKHPAAVAAWQQLGNVKNAAQSAGPQLVGENISVIRISRMQLLRIIGVRYGKSSVEALIRSLDKLSDVTISVRQRGDLWAKTRLIGDVSLSGDRLLIAINPRSAAAAMRMAGTYTMYSIDEMRRLKGDAALLLHASLSTFINAGDSTQIGLAKIEGRLWLSKISGVDRKAKEARRQRRRTIDKAMSELCAIGWKFAETSAGMFMVHRPALPTTWEEERPKQKPLTLDQGLLDDVGSLLATDA